MLDIVIYITGAIFVSVCFVVFFGSPYVRTRKLDIEKVMKIYPLEAGDVFVDIGSGDGVLLRKAASKGARAVGYELSPWLYIISKVLSRSNKNITIQLANFWRVKLPVDTTVVYTFLNGRHIDKLMRKLEAHVHQTGKPLYFVSYGFKPAGRKEFKKRGPVYLYKIEPESYTPSPPQTTSP